VPRQRADPHAEPKAGQHVVHIGAGVKAAPSLSSVGSEGPGGVLPTIDVRWRSHRRERLVRSGGTRTWCAYRRTEETNMPHI
jgi:hypothetical protein